jgi:hypothetical protein
MRSVWLILGELNDKKIPLNPPERIRRKATNGSSILKLLLSEIPRQKNSADKLQNGDERAIPGSSNRILNL